MGWLLLGAAPLLLQAPTPVSAQSSGAPSVAAPVPTGSVVARLDRGSVALGETVALTVIATDVAGELDTRVLEQVFDIVGRSRSRQSDVIDGVRRDRSSWTLELSPRRVGVFTVPPVTVDGVTSDLQTLEVTEAPTAGERLVFLEASVDETSPWVQGQVVMTLSVFQAIDFLDAALGEPLAEGLRVQRLGEDRRVRRVRDGREYDVVERRYALFPQRSGSITIEPVALDASVPVDPDRVRGFFTQSRRVLRRTEPIELQVRGRPPGSGGWWFPAREVSLEGVWSGTDPSLDVPAGADAATRVGVPLTRTVTLRALGAMSTQMPTLEPPELPGASLYAEAPERVEGASDAGVLTEQRIAWAVVPEQPGTLDLPPTTVSWFDTLAGRERTATLPATRIHVAPAEPDATASPAALAPPSDPVGGGADVSTAAGEALAGGQRTIGTIGAMGGFWRWLALAALLGWAITALLWWRKAGRAAAVRPTRVARPDAAPDAGQALQAVRDHQAGDSPARLADAVLAWGRARWPDRPPGSLPALAQRLPDAEAATTLRALDAAVYAPQDSVTMPPGTARMADLLEAACTPPGATDRNDPGRRPMAGSLPRL